LFHDGASDTAYAWVRSGSRRETLAVAGPQFKKWLARNFYRDSGSVPSGDALSNAAATLGGIAQFDGEDHSVSLRVAQGGGNIYLDLADAEWNIVEITPGGWKVKSAADITAATFRRPRGMLALPMPERGGSINLLRSFLNVRDEDDWRLLVSFLLASFRPSGPFPGLALLGGPGSTKTTMARVLRALIDPSISPARAEPSNVKDLVIAANGSWLVGFDNFSHVPTWLSDALCRLSTGGGFSTRELYTNDGEVIFEQQRPWVVTAITEIINRGDLLDRTIALYLPEVVKRIPEKVFWADFEAARPKILGALLDAVVVALANVNTVHLAKLPRLADFAMWSAAGAPALGFGADEFLAVYESNRAAAVELNLEISPLTPLLRQFVIDLPDGWSGTATELLARLADLAPETVRRRRDWPQAPNALSNALRRLAGSLRSSGAASVVFDNRDGKAGRRLIYIEAVPKMATEPGKACEII
jgi:hypothetical protein